MHSLAAARRVPLRLLPGLLAALVLLMVAAGGRLSPRAQAASGVYLGANITNVPYSMTPLAQFESDLGKHAAIVNFWRDFGSANNTIPGAYLANLDAHGSVPMVTWLPTNWNGGDQSAYSLSAIAGGSQDSYLRSWAQQLKRYGKPFLIRFAHEMNGNWYPQWSGNPGQYIAAWRHIHDVFAQAGATNVQWVWAPNIWYQVSLATDGRAYYPGDGYVDWVALDGYNNAPSGWQSFSTLFGYAYTQLTAMTGKPLMIAETASSEATAQQAGQGQSKAGWIQSAFATEIPQRFPRLGALLWTNDNLTASEGCCDWRIESSSQAQAAAHQYIGGSSLYLGTFGGSPAALGTPGLASPVEGATGVSRTPTVQWTAASGATASTQYTAFIWDPAANRMAFQQTVSGLSVSVPAGSPLAAGHFFYYTVQACNGSLCGPNARWEGFTTQSSLGTPGLQAPVEGSRGNGVTPTLRWSAASGATGSTTYTASVWDPSASVMKFQQTVSGLSVAVPASAGLVAGHFYYYSVQACTGSDCGPLARWEGFTS